MVVPVTRPVERDTVADPVGDLEPQHFPVEPVDLVEVGGAPRPVQERLDVEPAGYRRDAAFHHASAQLDRCAAGVDEPQPALYPLVREIAALAVLNAPLLQVSAHPG